MSSQKRELQKKRREKAIRKTKIKKTIRNLAFAAMGAVVVGLIGYLIYFKVAVVTKPIDDYSAGIAENGTIEGVNVQDYVKTGDYQNINVEYSDLNIDETYVDSAIENVLNSHKELVTDAGAVVQMQDEINIDFVGKIDGVAFEGGSTEGAGTIITVGSAGYIDDFEEQLVGHEIGTTFDIEVTFPEDYGNAEVAGKDAVFTITLNGIYVKPVFDDAFVKENLSDVALTADAYRAYLQETNEEAALKKYMDSYLKEYCLVQEYPEEYISVVMGQTKAYDMQELAYYEQMAGKGVLGTLYQFKGAENEMEYEASLNLRAREKAAYNMSVQAIYEEAGLTITSEHMDAVYSSLGGSVEYKVQMEEQYGKGYINQLAMKEAVIQYLIDNSTIVK